MIQAIVFLLLTLWASPSFADLPAGCESETGLVGRNDILVCEPWESNGWEGSWWLDAGDNGDVLYGRRFHHYGAGGSLGGNV